MQQEGEPKLRILVPDSDHAADRIARSLTKYGLPLRVRKNGGMHLEFPQDDSALPFDYILRKNAFIPEYVAEGRFLAGWTTTDREADFRVKAALSGIEPISIEEVLMLDVFNPTLRVSCLVRQDSDYHTIEDLNEDGKIPRVVSSYSNLAKEYFQKHNVQVEIDGRGGKEEELVYYGDADAAVVVVNKGTTMGRWVLRELGEPVMGRRRLEDPIMGRGELKLVLLCNPELFQDENNQDLLKQFVGRFPDEVKVNGNLTQLSSRVSPLAYKTREPHLPPGIRGVNQRVFSTPGIPVA